MKKGRSTLDKLLPEQQALTPYMRLALRGDELLMLHRTVGLGSQRGPLPGSRRQMSKPLLKPFSELE
jgi:hypothetical protein